MFLLEKKIINEYFMICDKQHVIRYEKIFSTFLKVGSSSLIYKRYISFRTRMFKLQICQNNNEELKNVN